MPYLPVGGLAWDVAPCSPGGGGRQRGEVRESLSPSAAMRGGHAPLDPPHTSTPCRVDSHTHTQHTHRTPCTAPPVRQKAIDGVLDLLVQQVKDQHAPLSSPRRPRMPRHWSTARGS